jgi:simple sugar transport system permease protein
MATVTDQPTPTKPSGGVRLPVRLRLHDPTSEAGGWLRAALILIGLLIGFVIISLSTSGLGLGSLFSTVWNSTFGTVGGIGSVIQTTTPLLLAGAAFAVGRKVGLWNIGIDGQLFFGAWLAAEVCFNLSAVPSGVVIPLALLGSFVGGVVAILIPALLRVYLNVSEIVTTLMFTFVGPLWVTYWATGPWSTGASLGAGNITSKNVPAQFNLPQLHIGSVTVGTGFIIAIGTCVIGWAAFRYLKAGFRAKLVGSDPFAARYAGVDVRRTQLVTFLCSGGLGGLTGGVVMLDQLHALSLGLSSSTGFLGVVVGALAVGSLLLVIPMGILLGAVATATQLGLAIAGVSPDSTLLLFGLLILLAGLADVASRYRIRPGQVYAEGPEPPPQHLDEPEPDPLEVLETTQ